AVLRVLAGGPRAARTWRVHPGPGGPGRTDRRLAPPPPTGLPLPAVARRPRAPVAYTTPRASAGVELVARLRRGDGSRPRLARGVRGGALRDLPASSADPRRHVRLARRAGVNPGRQSSDRAGADRQRPRSAGAA